MLNKPFSIGAVLFFWFPALVIALLFVFGIANPANSGTLESVPMMYVCGGIFALFVVIGIFRSVSNFVESPERGRWMTREEAETELRHMTGDYTLAELRAMEKADRAQWDEWHRGTALIHGADWYIDSRGYRRDPETNERLYMNPNDTGNGDQIRR